MAFIKKKLQDIADKSMESAENSIFKHKTENMLENCSNKKLSFTGTDCYKKHNHNFGGFLK